MLGRKSGSECLVASVVAGEARARCPAAELGVGETLLRDNSELLVRSGPVHGR